MASRSLSPAGWALTAVKEAARLHGADAVISAFEGDPFSNTSDEFVKALADSLTR